MPDRPVGRIRTDWAFELSEAGLGTRQIGEAIGVSTARALQLIYQGRKNEAFRQSDFSNGMLSRKTVNCLISNSDIFEYDFRESINLRTPEAIANLGEKRLQEIPGTGRIMIRNIKAWLATMGYELNP